MKLVLLTAVFLGLTESGTVWSGVLLTNKKIAPSVVHSVEYSAKPAMLENGKDIQNCIQRLPFREIAIATQVDKKLVKKQIKLKLKKAWTKAKKKQIKRNKEIGTKKTKTKLPKHTPKPSKRKEVKEVSSIRKPRHAEVEFHASLKSISDEPFPEEKKKGTYENGNCKLQCTWDCHDFRCFRRCICNHIK